MNRVARRRNASEPAGFIALRKPLKNKPARATAVSAVRVTSTFPHVRTAETAVAYVVPRAVGSMRNRSLCIMAKALVALIVLLAPEAQSQPPAPVGDVTAQDHPDDLGNQIIVRWERSPDDVVDAEASGDAPATVTGYEILREIAGEDGFQSLGETDAGETEFIDGETVAGTPYRYQVVTVTDGERSQPVTTAATVTSHMNWFRQDRGWLAIIILVVCGSVIGFIVAAKSGRELYVRRIPGLEAVDEAVGRATEMGRSCLFVPGILDINDIQTVAGITVLSHVAGLTADYGARLEVPTCRSLVMTTARETVEAAYLAAGRPDEYRENDINYLTDEQFGYVASVTATMMEEPPAACFYMGSFYAESLILAETGNAVGAIQVAGTAQPSQLPFFVAACDYTLIGEEFFAASAYLSNEPIQLGSLRGQDIGKVIAGVLIIVGCGMATWAVATGTHLLALTYLTENILGNGGFFR